MSRRCSVPAARSTLIASMALLVAVAVAACYESVGSRSVRSASMSRHSKGRGRGADVNARSLAGWTPLHFALLGIDGIDHADVETGLARKRKLVPVLIEHGADVNARTARAARTPLHLAVLLEGSEIVATLIEHGADVNVQTRLGGWTPLHRALNGCCADGIVAALRAAGGEDRAGGDADVLPMIS